METSKYYPVTAIFKCSKHHNNKLYEDNQSRVLTISDNKSNTLDTIKFEIKHLKKFYNFETVEFIKIMTVDKDITILDLI